MSASGYIDLHSHTDASDGSLPPPELVALWQKSDLAAISITDHDTFAGYDVALPLAKAAGLDLVRGIELNTRLVLAGSPHPRSLHLLVYFPSREPSPGFNAWLAQQRAERRDRNEKLVRALQERGVAITLAEVEERGRSVAGRPHFARILIDKGYVATPEEAFRRYLGEEAPSFVERECKTTEDAIQLALDGGGIPVVAHPIRLSLQRKVEHAVLVRLKQVGLLGLEVYHSDHPAGMQEYYRAVAEELELLPTGGSDFHGTPKPDIDLGTGRAHNLRVPAEFLKRLRERST